MLGRRASTRRPSLIPSGNAEQYAIAVNVTGLAWALLDPNRVNFHDGDLVLDIGKFYFKKFPENVYNIFK